MPAFRGERAGRLQLFSLCDNSGSQTPLVQMSLGGNKYFTPFQLHGGHEPGADKYQGLL